MKVVMVQYVEENQPSLSTNGDYETTVKLLLIDTI